MKQEPKKCIETIDLTKQYPGTRALDGVNFVAYSGCVNSVVGENGAGKSTLMKILAGNIKPTQGQILLDGKPIEINSVENAREQGIGIIHQELNLFPNLTITENIFVGKEIKKHGILVDKDEQIKRTKEVLERLDYPLDPMTKVSELKVGQKQIVEIAKALVDDNLKILIMDEPTSSLSNTEVTILMNVIEDLKKMGISILYISHRLEEVLSISDYITVLRDGKLVASQKNEDLDIAWIAHHMIGETEERDYHFKSKKLGTPILEVRDLNLFDPERGQILTDINFELHESEILGIYGLLGSGRTELLECIMGLRNNISGELFFKQELISTENIREQINRGFFIVPEERQREGLIQKSSILNNLTVSSLSRYAKSGVISSLKKLAAGKEMEEDLKIKMGSIHDLIVSLSGGNQQKVVIGKGLLTEPEILLLDEPTKGVDIGAKQELFQIISSLAYKQGLSIILVSSETKEILSISDRILVLSNGKISGEFTGDKMNQENILKAASANLKERAHVS